ncbi:(2Fe-2S)-binding protein [Streptomyces sp. NPDC101132]|uniref:(2Fe-2S)-binding protein n=1 Tax=Streptomyces sp. NPDC101132 TaxID=3366110 RepID=UPI003821921C
MIETIGRLAAVGPYFTAGCGAPPAGYRPLTELYGPALDGYVAETARRMGTAHTRVAASTAHLGIASRLWSLALGCAALDGRVPDLAPDRVLWHLPAGGSLTLWLPDPEPRPEPGARGMAASVLEGNLPVLDARLRTGSGLSDRILRGNSASALVGALRVLGNRAPGTPYSPAALVAELLDGDGPLADTAHTWIHEPDLGTAFVRNSCCLYYQAPGGGLCGDCVLRTRPARGGPVH